MHFFLVCPGRRQHEQEGGFLLALATVDLTLSVKDILSVLCAFLGSILSVRTAFVIFRICLAFLAAGVSSLAWAARLFLASFFRYAVSLELMGSPSLSDTLSWVLSMLPSPTRQKVSLHITSQRSVKSRLSLLPSLNLMSIFQKLSDKLVHPPFAILSIVFSLNLSRILACTEAIPLGDRLMYFPAKGRVLIFPAIASTCSSFHSGCSFFTFR